MIKRMDVMMDIMMNFPALGKMFRALLLSFSIIVFFVTLVWGVPLGSESLLSQIRGAF